MKNDFRKNATTTDWEKDVKLGDHSCVQNDMITIYI